MNILSKIKRKIRHSTITIIENYLFSHKTKSKNEHITVLKLDAIGDYILFRNFIEELHETKSGCKITLCGNALWKDLAENLDAAFIDNFIWVKVGELDKFRYRYSLYKKLRQTKSSVLLHPTYSRTGDSDKLALASGAKTIIGYDGDCANITKETKLINNPKYSQLVSSSQVEMFEFYRYRTYFEEVLQKKTSLQRPFITSTKIASENKYILIFPGAGHATKRWSVSNFKQLCNLLYKEYQLPFVFCGSKEDTLLVTELTKDPLFPFTDLTGKKNLFELIDPISKAALVIANDSGPFHISAALNIHSICIFKGNHFGRFCPYPKEISQGLLFICPEEAKNNLADANKRKLMYLEGLEINLDAISPNEVFKLIKNFPFLN